MTKKDCRQCGEPLSGLPQSENWCRNGKCFPEWYKARNPDWKPLVPESVKRKTDYNPVATPAGAYL